jgi:hypothetical protein
MACYIDGLLSNDEIRQIEKHLLDCDRCREEVEVTKKVVARVEEPNNPPWLISNPILKVLNQINVRLFDCSIEIKGVY